MQNSSTWERRDSDPTLGVCPMSCAVEHPGTRRIQVWSTLTFLPLFKMQILKQMKVIYFRSSETIVFNLYFCGFLGGFNTRDIAFPKPMAL